MKKKYINKIIANLCVENNLKKINIKFVTIKKNNYELLLPYMITKMKNKTKTMKNVKII